MKAKIESATTKIMRLLDRLSAYSFNLYYVKGRDMSKDIDPSELIPISFCVVWMYTEACWILKLGLKCIT